MAPLPPGRLRKASFWSYHGLPSLSLLSTNEGPADWLPRYLERFALPEDVFAQPAPLSPPSLYALAFPLWLDPLQIPNAFPSLHTLGSNFERVRRLCYLAS